MQLVHMTWPEVDNYLDKADGVIIATGSTEQHGPIGLIGTDAICANAIATAVADSTDSIVAPPLAYTPAPFNTAFPGTISINAELFQQLAAEVFNGLSEQGLVNIYVVNGHGANLQPLADAALAVPAARVKIVSWWAPDEVRHLIKNLYGEWEGMHATPSEIAISQHLTGIVHQGAKTPPKKLSPDYIRKHAGDKHGPPLEHRNSFPCGRVGSHSALAEVPHGQQIFTTAVRELAADYLQFVALKTLKR